MKENWEIVWKDYYEILQVGTTVEPNVLKATFDKLARKYHPDINKEPEALNQMKDLNEAFEILNNPLKRAAYDAECQRKENAHNSYSPNYDMETDITSIWCHKWAPCPRCNHGNMYLEYNIEWICLQCGYRFSKSRLNEGVSANQLKDGYV